MSNPLKTLVQDTFHSEPENEIVRERNLAPSFFFSFLAHVFLVLLLFLSTKYFSLQPAEQEQVVEIFPLNEENGEYKIADIAPPKNQSRPKTAKYAGIYDSSVEHETVRRKNSRVDSRDAGDAQRKSAKKAGAKKNIYDFDKSLFYKQQITQARNEGVHNVDIGGGGNEDYFPNYTYGDHTYLNVHRFLHLDYFVRLKRAFRVAFSPEHAVVPHLAQINRGQLSTVVGVSVNAQGELTELFVLRGSGLSDYDQEVMRTVKVSSPFPSPPTEMLQKDKMLRMSWTFTLYL